MSSGLAWAEAAFLGLVQGLTEFLPVSSSAHLRILGPLLSSGLDPGAAFTAITQLGTEAAVLLYFRHDIVRIAKAWCLSLASGGGPADPDARIGWLIIIGTLPIAVLGLLLKDAIEGPLRNLYLTTAMLISFALVLAAADRFGSKQRTLDQLGWRHGVLFGLALALAQALALAPAPALIPGVSRSGGTITAGLIMGHRRDAAALYSFLLAVPAVLASGFYQLYRSWGHGSAFAPGPTALATLVAFGVGYGVIVLFLRLVSTGSYMPFVYYRIVLGLVVLALIGTGAIAPA